ncbi:MAG: SusD/RagB family nutrient-binding outer membrane lipoprotein [Bacteroidota bacterium]|nr:SusD/RagB family nutrient-binding outer membrane lipoprotein [Bacteroidota bacterium]
MPATAQDVITASWEGAFTSNADNAFFSFLNGTPNNNPLNENQKVRTDFAVAKPLIDMMNDRNDPRLPFFANSPVNEPGTFTGFPYGMSQSEATPLSNNDFTMPGDCVYAPTAPGMLMNYSEVCFIMAEAAERFGLGGDAQQWYETGIRANMEMWNGFLGLTNLNTFYRLDNPSTERPEPAMISETMVDDYLADPMVAWGSADALELIGTQKYLALYPQGLQAWFEYTRTGYPTTLLQPGETVAEYDYTFTPLNAITNIPYRMEYPSEEQTLNGDSYDAAVAAQGNDNMSTKLWWNKK